MTQADAPQSLSDGLASELIVYVAHRGEAAKGPAETLGRLLYERLVRPIPAGDQAPRRNAAISNGRGGSIPVLLGVPTNGIDTDAARLSVIIEVDGALDQGRAQPHLTEHAIHRCTLPLAHCERADGGLSTAVHAIYKALAGPERPLVLGIVAAPDSDEGRRVSERLQTAMTDPFVLADQSDDDTRQKDPYRVVLAVRDAGFGFSAPCLDAVLRAKRRDVPVVQVMELTQGERESPAALANCPGIAWRDRPSEVLTEAMVAWIRAETFRRLARRMFTRAGLPDCHVVSRPPEYFDVNRSDLDSASALTIFHPDPELTVYERRGLLQSNPRAQFLTPTTAFRFLRHEATDEQRVTRRRRSPLGSALIGLSLSEPCETALADGVLRDHIDDAIEWVARAIVAAGGALAYGGDLRENGYTVQLARIIEAYSCRAQRAPDALHSFLDAHHDPAPHSHIRFHHMATDDLSAPLGTAAGKLRRELKPLLTSEQAAQSMPSASSDTRRIMGLALTASVMMSGKVERGDGLHQYRGRFPGLLEETWRMFEAEKPVYLVGGFGGMTALIASLRQVQGLPDAFIERDDVSISPVDARWAGELGLPESLKDMASQTQSMLKARLVDDAASLAWNGLSVAQNERLMTSQDPSVIASLVLKGLTRIAWQASGDTLEIELIHGDIVQADLLDVMSLPGMSGAPLRGPSARADRALDGRLQVAFRGTRALLGVHQSRLPADWVHLARWQESSSDDAQFEAVSATEDLATKAERNGFERVGLALYGGTQFGALHQSVDDIVAALRPLSGKATIFWYEGDRERFWAIEEQLRKRAEDSLYLTASEGELLLDNESPNSAFMRVSYCPEDERLHTLLVPRDAGATALEFPRRLTEQDLIGLNLGACSTDDPKSRSYPAKTQVVKLGEHIAECLFGERASDICAQLKGQSVELAVDSYASLIPLELMRAQGEPPLATQAPFTRRFTTPCDAVDRMFLPHMSSRRLRSLVVMAETDENLRGIRAEIEAVCKVLAKFSEVDLVKPEDATRDNVLPRLESAHIFYCAGHGYYASPNPKHCGLCLNDKHLTAYYLDALDHLPRVTYLSSCELGRVRDHEGKAIDGTLAKNAEEVRSASFAEHFFRVGTEAYIGAHWNLGSDSATALATEFFQQIEKGATVADALLSARSSVFKTGGQWGNLVMYGHGNLRLRKPDPADAT